MRRCFYCFAVLLTTGCTDTILNIPSLFDAGTQRDASAAADSAIAEDGGMQPPPDAQIPIDSSVSTHHVFTPFLDDARIGMVHDIWSASPRDVWFVTSTSQILHWTGGSTTNQWDFSGGAIHAVFGTSPSKVWVVGEDGLIANFDGKTGFDVV